MKTVGFAVEPLTCLLLLGGWGLDQLAGDVHSGAKGNGVTPVLQYPRAHAYTRLFCISLTWPDEILTLFATTELPSPNVAAIRLRTMPHP